MTIPIRSIPHRDRRNYGNAFQIWRFFSRFGALFARPDKREVRPTLAVIDDPQDDESANSPSQCERRERIVSATVLGLAGPGRKIAAVMPCTVIREGDLA